MITQTSANILPTKWNVFKIITIIHLILNIGILILVLLSTLFVFIAKHREEEDYLVIMILFFIPICVCFFDGIVLNLIFKKFPNKQISYNLNLGFGILFILVCICFTLITCFFIFGFIETYKSFQNTTPDYNSIAALIIIFIYLLGLGYVTKNGLRLRNFIRKNSIILENDLIELIGKSK